jgi:hypothetical protein
MTHDALMTLIHARERQDGLAPDGLPRHGYLLCHGQPVGLRAETLALLRQHRGTLQQRLRAWSTHGDQAHPIPRVETSSLERRALLTRGQMHRN